MEQRQGGVVDEYDKPILERTEDSEIALRIRDKLMQEGLSYRGLSLAKRRGI